MQIRKLPKATMLVKTQVSGTHNTLLDLESCSWSLRLLCSLVDYVDLSQSNVVEEGCSFATKEKGMQSIKELERVHETLVSQLPAFSSLAATQSLDATLAVAGERLESMQAGFGGSTDLAISENTDAQKALFEHQDKTCQCVFYLSWVHRPGWLWLSEGSDTPTQQPPRTLTIGNVSSAWLRRL